MPSPFPGMDPYLEDADIWPDFHEAFVTEFRGVLNALLPIPYYARLERRPEVGVTDDEPGERYTRRPNPDVIVPSERAQHRFVEIRDPRRGHHLVTVIEILSPNCKRQGPDRREFLRKHEEVYQSDASLVEIDLLRDGQRVLHGPAVADAVAAQQPPPDYLVLVNRAWRRDEQVAFQLFPFTVRDPLPGVPVPLREGEAELPLDLQFVFNRAYDMGPYLRGAVNYALPPQPPLPGPEAEWAAQRLRERGLLPG